MNTDTFDEATQRMIDEASHAYEADSALENQDARQHDMIETVVGSPQGLQVTVNSTLLGGHQFSGQSDYTDTVAGHGSVKIYFASPDLYKQTTGFAWGISAASPSKKQTFVLSFQGKNGPLGCTFLTLSAPAKQHFGKGTGHWMQIPE